MNLKACRFLRQAFCFFTALVLGSRGLCFRRLWRRWASGRSERGNFASESPAAAAKPSGEPAVGQFKI